MEKTTFFGNTRCTANEREALLALARAAKVKRSEALRSAVREAAAARGLWPAAVDRGDGPQGGKRDSQ